VTTTGRTLPTLRLVTIVAEGDPLRDQVFAFGDALVTSEWLAAVTADYGIAPTGTSQHLVGPALTGNVTMADMRDYVRRAVAASGGQLAPASAPAVYLLYLPATAQYTDGDGINCQCNELNGAHDSLDASNAFAFVQRCSAGDAEQATVTASHEVIEALTDPVPGEGVLLPTNTPADFLGGGEVADLCNETQVDEGGWVYQRSWSNSAAGTGGDPCVPASPAPYFNVSAEKQWFPASPGQALQIPLTAWSTAPRPDWYVIAFVGSGAPPGTTVTLTTASGQAIDDTTFYAVNNGGTATLSVTLPTKVPDASMPVVVEVLSLSADPREDKHSTFVGIAMSQ
jgi:hypothetical protein